MMEAYNGNGHATSNGRGHHYHVSPAVAAAAAMPDELAVDENRARPSSTFFLLMAKAIRWSPVTAIVAVIIWSYYLLLTQMAPEAADGGLPGVAYLAAIHVLLLMTCWSFAAVISTPPGESPETWRLSPAMVDSLENAATEDEWKSYLELFALQMNVVTMQRSVQGAMR